MTPRNTISRKLDERSRQRATRTYARSPPQQFISTHVMTHRGAQQLALFALYVSLSENISDQCCSNWSKLLNFDTGHRILNYDVLTNV